MGDVSTRVDPRGRALPEQELTQAAVALYGHLAQGGKLRPGDEEAFAALRTWGMVGDTAQAGEKPVVLPPVEAGWSVAKSTLLHLLEQIHRLEELPRTLQPMNLEFARSQFRASTGSEFLADRTVVNKRIEEILKGAQFELLSAHPTGSRTQEQMELGVPRDTAALRRGVRFRTLYRDAVRDDAVTCEWATQMVPEGAHFRTLVDSFERVIIVDRRVAVISNYAIPDAPDGAAWIITDLAMVGFCVSAFEQEWRRATPWHGERRIRGRRAGEGLLSETHRAILRCFAEGDTLDGVGHRLGMAKRTLQRQLTQIRAVWNLPNATIAQLTFRWATCPERDVDLEQAA